MNKEDGGSLAVPMSAAGGLGIVVDEGAVERFHVPLKYTGVVQNHAHY